MGASAAFAFAALVLLTAQPGLGRFRDTVPASGPGSINGSAAELTFTPRKWRVDPDTSLLTLVQPIFPSEFELGQFHNQLRTLSHFFDSTSIKEFVLITPTDQAIHLETFLQDYIIGHLPNMPIFTLITDDECAPDVRNATMKGHTDVSLFGTPIPGWVKQQLLKLSAAGLMQTPYYMVMDSDVFFTKHFKAVDLFKVYDCTKESLICDTHGQFAYQARNDEFPIFSRNSDQKEWMRATAATLKLHVPLDWRVAMGVTPQIFATDVPLQLSIFIQRRFSVTRWLQFLIDALSDSFNEANGWKLPWTEYNLYWIFAHHVGVWDDYHTGVPVLQGNAIWTQSQFNSWDACKDTFEAETPPGEGFFSLVQSRMQIDPALIWAKMAPCLGWEVPSIKEDYTEAISKEDFTEAT